MKNWDYSSAAIYFITLVTQNRECIFGSIKEDKMILNENGQIIENELLKSIKIRNSWFFHNWIVMPNHIHLLIEIQNNKVSREINNLSKEIETSQIERSHIVETHSSASTFDISTTNIAANIAETHCCAPLRNHHENNYENNHANKYGSQLSRKPNSISSFVAIFKSVTTKQVNGLDSIWQSNYHDHIVRNYKTFETIYNYIKTNPSSWETDSMKL
ncbi:transposase [Flavobacterium aquidurense]|uniref:transposase n=1 Tax=Flavobacterium aquidurense TaxID=362413 RepID=UPI0012FA6CD8|nr:transposase [Flavobacterium aquidurense]